MPFLRHTPPGRRWIRLEVWGNETVSHMYCDTHEAEGQAARRHGVCDKTVSQSKGSRRAVFLVRILYLPEGGRHVGLYSEFGTASKRDCATDFGIRRLSSRIRDGNTEEVRKEQLLLCGGAASRSRSTLAVDVQS